MPTEAVPLDEPFHDRDQQARGRAFGMWVFLATEAMMFGGLFLGFAVYRSAWPDSFAEGASHLHAGLGALNTALLMTSGLLMALSEPLAERGRRRAAIAAVTGAALLGLAFLGIKGHEYALEYADRLVPFAGLPFDDAAFAGPSARIFFSFYFVMTGLHALHMLIGIVALAILARCLATADTAAAEAGLTRMTGLYWAFVDMVWLLLFPTLYLLGGGA